MYSLSFLSNIFFAWGMGSRCKPPYLDHQTPSCIWAWPHLWAEAATLHALRCASLTIHYITTTATTTTTYIFT